MEVVIQVEMARQLCFYAQNPVSSRSTTGLTLASATGPCQVSWSAMLLEWTAAVNKTILSHIDKKILEYTYDAV